ncbi:hypothetical protein [Brevibacillus centrosporus]|nr:hypothetical protein [Brevibacillus centrosporus]MEC2130894.1 hypothetical protein [Brevibacillus centrosporus]MED4908009.1 hypothetical protein [Brevibacillus centrosporus]GED34798.1 hypothetical protein BCE02nite_59390 [Brevibacillus centrosporus]
MERIRKPDPLLHEHLDSITDRHYEMLKEFVPPSPAVTPCQSNG